MITAAVLLVLLAAVTLAGLLAWSLIGVADNDPQANGGVFSAGPLCAKRDCSGAALSGYLLCSLCTIRTVPVCAAAPAPRQAWPLAA